MRFIILRFNSNPKRVHSRKKKERSQVRKLIPTGETAVNQHVLIRPCLCYRIGEWIIFIPVRVYLYATK